MRLQRAALSTHLFSLENAWIHRTNVIECHSEAFVRLRINSAEESALSRIEKQMLR
jgi:hypothetical protein